METAWVSTPYHFRQFVRNPLIKFDKACQSTGYQESHRKGFPLTLITNYSKKWLLSQLLQKDHPRAPWARIAPETAAAYCLTNGGRALVRTPSGQREIEVAVDDTVPTDIVVMPVGTWVKRGGGVNVSTEDIMSNFGEIAAYGEIRVRLEAL